MDETSTPTQTIEVPAEVAVQLVETLARLNETLTALRKPHDRLLTLEDVGELLQKSPQDVSKLIRLGKLKLKKVPNLGNKTTRFRRVDVERALAPDDGLGRARL